jgi:hypothetical protein
VPYAYEIDHQRRLVVSRWWGVTDDEELIDFYQRLRCDPAFKPSYRELVDTRAVERFATASVTIQVVARLRVFAVGTRRAAAVGNEVAFGLGRMFGNYAEREGYDVEVFRSKQAALDWLDSPPS